MAGFFAAPDAFHVIATETALPRLASLLLSADLPLHGHTRRALALQQHVVAHALQMKAHGTSFASQAAVYPWQQRSKAGSGTQAPEPCDAAQLGADSTDSMRVVAQMERHAELQRLAVGDSQFLGGEFGERILAWLKQLPPSPAAGAQAVPTADAAAAWQAYQSWSRLVAAQCNADGRLASLGHVEELSTLKQLLRDGEDTAPSSDLVERRSKRWSDAQVPLLFVPEALRDLAQCAGRRPGEGGLRRGVLNSDKDWSRSAELSSAMQSSAHHLVACWHALQRMQALVHAVPL